MNTLKMSMVLISFILGSTVCIYSASAEECRDDGTDTHEVSHANSLCEGSSIITSLPTVCSGTITSGISKPLLYKIESKRDMIMSASVIAIVDIDQVEVAQTHAALAFYHQRARAKVERVLKGDPGIKGSNLPVFGDEQKLFDLHTFLVPGRFLVFLKVDTVSESGGYIGPERNAAVFMGIYAGANGYASIRPIHDDKIQWYSDDYFASEIVAPLQAVIGEIQKVLAASATSDSKAQKHFDWQ